MLKNNVYYNIAADGHTNPYFSVVRQLFKESDNSYSVIFDVYEVLDLQGDGIPDTNYYSLDSKSAKDNPDISIVTGGIAVIAKDKSGNYYIKDYKETEETKNSSNTSNNNSTVSYVQTSSDENATSIPSVNESAEQSSKLACTHEKYFKGEGILLIPGFYDIQPGIENRVELSAECTEKRHVVYKCPQCFEPVLYEELEPKGHDFPGEDTVIFYPSVEKEGSYGKRCQRSNCNGVLSTKPIAKRTGNYSTIDSCFTVGVSNFDNGEYYTIENRSIHISDHRTWGNVPTIKYDLQTNKGTIEFIGKDNLPVQHYISIDMKLINQGYAYYGTILDNGLYECKYSRLVINGS